MSGLVIELQRDATNKKVDISDLLRKAKVVSKKLSINEIEDWINNELSGYSSDVDIPEYREVRGVARVFNPYRGWQNIELGHPGLMDVLSKRKMGRAIGELVALLINNNESGNLNISWGHDLENMLKDILNLPSEPFLCISVSQIDKIFDAVRNKILYWALDLEAKGIVGEGMSFSNEEREVASQINYQIINNIGSMKNSQLQQDSAGATQTQNIMQSSADIAKFIQQLKESIHALGLQQRDVAELEAEVRTIECQVVSPKPKSLIISESLKSIRSILEGVGSALATNLLVRLANLI